MTRRRCRPPHLLLRCPAGLTMLLVVPLALALLGVLVPAAPAATSPGRGPAGAASAGVPSTRAAPPGGVSPGAAFPAVADPSRPHATAGQGVWPLTGPAEVTRGFSPPPEPWLPGHRGVDLAGRVGQAVRAALPGRISWVGTIAGTAIVVVQHGTTRTTYQPVTATLGVGQRVAAGEVIGTLVRPGSHCFPRACLHWGWKRGEDYLDPLRLVGGGPVRLLPVPRGEAWFSDGSRRWEALTLLRSG